MAERRMFSKKVIGSARFLRMPPSSRLLYYDLGMNADDDGVVEAFSVMRQTQATEDDLRVLVSKGFVRVLNEDLVTLITDWSVNNQIRKDRYHPSLYTNLLVQMNGNDNQWSTDGQPFGNQLETEVSIGKDSIGKDRSGKRGRFAPPTLSEVEDYIKEKGYHISAEAFVQFYASKNWMVGKNKMISWHSAVGGWETRWKQEHAPQADTQFAREADELLNGIL